MAGEAKVKTGKVTNQNMAKGSLVVLSAAARKALALSSVIKYSGYGCIVNTIRGDSQHKHSPIVRVLWYRTGVLSPISSRWLKVIG